MAKDPKNNQLEYEPTKRNESVHGGRLLLSIPLPTLLQAAFIFAAEVPFKNSIGHSAWYGWLALAASIVFGGVLLGHTGLRRAELCVALLIFVVVQTGWLVFFSISFACGVFGDCL